LLMSKWDSVKIYDNDEHNFFGDDSCKHLNIN